MGDTLTQIAPARLAEMVENHFHADWDAFVKNVGGYVELRYLLRETNAWMLLKLGVRKNINRNVQRRGSHQ